MASTADEIVSVCFWLTNFDRPSSVIVYAAADRQGAYLAQKIVAVTSWGSTWLQKNLFSEGKSSSSQKR